MPDWGRVFLFHLGILDPSERIDDNCFSAGAIISPLSVRASVSHELISETAPRIFPKLGMKLGDNKGKKIAERIFEKNSHFAQIWPNVRKNGHFLAKIAVFLGHCEKMAPTNFLKLH